MRLVTYLRYILGLGGAAPRDRDPDILKARERQHKLLNKAQTVFYPPDDFTRRQVDAWHRDHNQAEGQR